MTTKLKARDWLNHILWLYLLRVCVCVCMWIEGCTYAFFFLQVKSNWICYIEKYHTKVNSIRLSYTFNTYSIFKKRKNKHTHKKTRIHVHSVYMFIYGLIVCINYLSWNTHWKLCTDTCARFVLFCFFFVLILLKCTYI